MTGSIKTNLPDDHRLASIRGLKGEVVPNISEDPKMVEKYSHEFYPEGKGEFFYFVNLDEIDTVHSEIISRMRAEVEEVPDGVQMAAAADLLELHDRTGISLDDMGAVRKFVELYAGGPITPNGV